MSTRRAGGGGTRMAAPILLGGLGRRDQDGRTCPQGGTGVGGQGRPRVSSWRDQERHGRGKRQRVALLAERLKRDGVNALWRMFYEGKGLLRRRCKLDEREALGW